MDSIKTVEDFKAFLNNNRDKLVNKSIRIEDLSPDDEWVLEDDWDKVYEQEHQNSSKV